MSSNTQTGRTSPRVLVLGEESSARVGLTDLLTEDGFRAMACEGAAEALAALPEVDAMVIEQNLPYENLAELIAKVVRRDPRVPVFVITPYCDTEQKLAAVDLGPRACFPMPLAYDDLVAALWGCSIRQEAKSHLEPPPAIDAEAVSLLDRRGPRYTSYPTAPVFSDSFQAAQYEAALMAAGAGQGPLALYVHLPFCQSLCTYCACNVAVRTDVRRAARAYVSALLEEARMVREFIGGSRRIIDIHLGGGTPNYLPRDQIERLVAGLEARFPCSPGISRAIEVDPRHFDGDQLDWLSSLGFSRLSLGIQDVEAEVQRAIGRHQTIESTEATIKAARAAGFDSINVDLVYGLPAQTRESFASTLSRIIELRPDRLAVFSFAYVPTHKPQQKKLEMSLAATGRDKAQLFLDAMQRLTTAGYVQVGMNYFALPGDPLARSYLDGSLHRSFLGYVPGPAQELIGLGASSIGDIGGAYAQNHRSVSDWHHHVKSGVLPVARGWKRTFDDEVRRAVIRSLMCRFQLVYSELSEGFGIEHDRYFEGSLEALASLEVQGLLRRHEEGLTVTPLGRLFVRNVAMVYDAYFKDDSGTSSRTV